jgi:hypothetical protein
MEEEGQEGAGVHGRQLRVAGVLHAVAGGARQGGLRVASKDAHWSALYREPTTRDFVGFFVQSVPLFVVSTLALGSVFFSGFVVASLVSATHQSEEIMEFGEGAEYVEGQFRSTRDAETVFGPLVGRIQVPFLHLFLTFLNLFLTFSNLFLTFPFQTQLAPLHSGDVDLGRHGHAAGWGLYKLWNPVKTRSLKGAWFQEQTLTLEYHQSWFQTVPFKCNLRHYSWSTTCSPPWWGGAGWNQVDA